MKRHECGRAKTAREVRRDASPRIEGRKEAWSAAVHGVAELDIV